MRICDKCKKSDVDVGLLTIKFYDPSGLLVMRKEYDICSTCRKPLYEKIEEIIKEEVK